MRMESQQYFDNDKERKAQNIEIPSEDTVSPGWPMLGSFFPGTTPKPGQDLPIEHTEQMADGTLLSETQEHDSGVGTEIPPEGPLLAAEEPPVPVGVETTVATDETGLSTSPEGFATPEAAGLLPQEAPPEIAAPRSPAPSEVERSSEVSSPELQALLELQELGLIEIEGEPIANLISLARSRAQALDRLAEARKCFVEGMDGNETLVQQAVQDAQAALRALEEIRYPERETFSARRVALAGDLAQVRALLAALDTWWWHRFAQALAEVYALFKTPQQAQQSLTRAETLLSGWPKLENSLENSMEAKAKEVLATARKELEEGLVERQFRALLDEAEAWVALANASTDDATGGEADNGTLALEYAIRAETAYRAAGTLKAKLKNKAESDATNALDKLAESLTNTKQKALQIFSETILQRRRKLVNDLIKQWQEDIRRAGIADVFTDKSEQARGLRQRLDDLIELIRLDPSYIPSDAIHRREKNRRLSAELAGEAKRLWMYATSQSSELQPDTEAYIYRVLRLLKDVEELDPDLNTNDGETWKLLGEIENKWRQLQEEIESLFTNIETEQKNLSQALDEFEKQELGNLDEGKKITSFKEKSEDIESSLSVLKDRLSRHLETPLEWNERIRRLQQQYNRQKAQENRIASTLQRAKELVEAWKTPHDLPRLIEETQALCCSDTLPGWVRQAAVTAVREAVRQALPEIRRRRPPLPRQIELTWLIGELNAAVARLETPTASREAGS